MTRSLLQGAAMLALAATAVGEGVTQAVTQAPTFTSATRTVAVYATVTGPDGRLVTDLQRGAFSVFDNRKRQEITLFSTDTQPITVVMLLDRSGSMRANFRIVEEAAAAFVNAMMPSDKARIGSFSNRIQIDPRDFTSDRQQLLAILKTELQPEGPTPLWNAVNVGITALLHQDGRRVILVFTDGADRPDTMYSASLKDVMKRAEEEDVMVYAIGLVGSMPAPGFMGPRGGGFPRGRRGGFGGGPGRGAAAQDKPDEGLPKIAAATGGGYFELTSAADLASTFARVAEELHRQYAMGFTPEKLDGKMHALDVRVADAGMTVRARKSYLAGPSR